MAGAVPKKYRPSIKTSKKGDICKWDIFPQFHENEGLATLGLLQEALFEKNSIRCDINFSQVEWADPQPLLSLILLLAESNLHQDDILVNLTDGNSSASHRVFLKFLAQQGFLDLLNKHTKIFIDKQEYIGSFFKLKQQLSDIPEETHFLMSDCIYAKAICMDEYQNNLTGMQGLVEELITEAHERAFDFAFGGKPYVRDVLFQKIRKLLFELLLNIYEHSHEKSTNVYAGVYARIRQPKPINEDKAADWSSTFELGNETNGQHNFSPNVYSEWLELFVCDVGVGLTHHIKDWSIPDDPKLARDIKKAQNSKNPFNSIAIRLFRDPLSRHIRHDKNRTAVTGLQSLGQILKIGGDYGRIYTQKGFWVGDKFPWNSDTYSRIDINTYEKYKELRPVSGTAYTFSIQPEHDNAENYDSLWSIPHDECLKSIINKLTQNTQASSSEEFYDRRTFLHCNPPSELPSNRPDVVILRPPRLMSKQDLSSWLQLVVGSLNTPPVRPAKFFIIADLTPFQVIIFRELLLNIDTHTSAELILHLVSDSWSVISLSTNLNDNIFKTNEESTKLFIGTGTEGQYVISDLALVLREMDSLIFWGVHDDKTLFSPFFEVPVEWGSSSGNKTKLNNYLDFTHVITDPKRYRACRRALRRCLSLFPTFKPINSDDIVASILRDVISNSYRDVPKHNESVILVGSISVTSGTINKLENELHNKNIEKLHLMIHGENQNLHNDKELSALLWQSDLPNQPLSPEMVKGKRKPWKRIPNTPYIAPDGEKSVSINRYQRNPDGSLNYDEPLYDSLPETMYRDFQQLGILKLGHWKNGSRHDLLTINTKQAFQSSFLEKGVIYNWLIKQFETFFSGDSKKAQFLIYPSHSVTDSLLDKIRQDKSFTLPQGGMIPVNFVGMQTVSPLLASYLVDNQIKKIQKEEEISSWSAVILDDGTVSGKHLNELKLFIKSLNAKKVYTIAILDRTGLPAQENLIEKFLKKNKRLWKWDVPALGNKRDCPICQALLILQTFEQNLISERQSKRLSEWKDEWQVLDVNFEWHKGGMQQRPLNPALGIKFGISKDDDYGARSFKTLHLNSSTTANSVLLELTRLTTRADVTINKIKELEEGQTDIAIEILASQLLLFFDELSMSEKKERYEKLISLVWSQPLTSMANSLAGLCFSLLDDEMVTNLWTYCIKNLITKKELQNLDAILSTNIIKKHYSSVSKEEFLLSEQSNVIEIHNYILLGGNRNLKEDIGAFLAFYRNPSEEGLSSHLTPNIEKIQKLRDFSITQYIVKDVVNEVLYELRLIDKAIGRMIKEQLIPKSNHDKLSDYLKNLQLTLDELHSVEQINTQLENKVKELGKSFLTLLYGDDIKAGLVTTIGQLLFPEIKNIQIDVFEEAISKVSLNWTDLIELKRQRGVTLASKRWDKIAIKPSFKCSSIKAEAKLWMYHDSYTIHIINDILTNVYHANKKIFDPFTSKQSSEKAHCWWEIKQVEKAVIFTMANSSANKKFSLKQTVNIASLERIGGSIDTNTDDDLIAYTTIQLPLFNAFIKD